MLSQFSSIRGRIGGLARVLRHIVPQKRTYWFVSCDVNHVPFLRICACCLAPTEGGRREVARGGTGATLVPYCNACLSKVGRFGLAMMAWNLSSVLLGVAGCLYVPLIPWISGRTATLTAAIVAGLPWLLGQLWSNATADDAPGLGRAVFIVKGGLACMNSQWATRLGELLETKAHSQRRRIATHVGWACAGVVIALVATPWLYDILHPYVRILNLTDNGVVVFADGHELVHVQPTSGENPLAGSLTRVPSGKRHFTVRQLDGVIVEDLTVYVFAGHHHLFAPAKPQGVCFWVERAQVGRSRNPVTKRTLLWQQDSFWSLDNEVDAWFRPAQSSNSARVTGGVVRALRQGACPSTLSE